MNERWLTVNPDGTVEGLSAKFPYPGRLLLDGAGAIIDSDFPDLVEEAPAQDEHKTDPALLAVSAPDSDAPENVASEPLLPAQPDEQISAPASEISTEQAAQPEQPNNEPSPASDGS